MANKAINVLLALKDQFSSPMKRAAQNTKDAQRQMKIAQNNVMKLASGANGAFLGMTKSVASFGSKLAAIAGIGGLGATIASMKSLASQSMELWDVQARSEMELETMLGNVKKLAKGGNGAVKAAANDLKAYASQLQEVGVVGDEVTIRGMGTLASFQLTTEEIKKLAPGMLDALVKSKGVAATAEDAVAAANKLGKVISTGAAGELAEWGIVLTKQQERMIKYGNQSQKVAAIQQALKENVGGLNKAMAATDAGKAQQALNSWGDALEEVGKELRPLKTELMSTFKSALPTIQATVIPMVKNLRSVITEAMPKIKSAIESAVQRIPDVINRIGSIVEVVFPKLKAALGFVIDHSEILLGIFAGFAAYNIAAKIAAVVSPMIKFVNAVRTAGGVFKVLNAVMLANPLAMFGLAVGALVVGMIALYKRSEKFRNACDALFSALKTFGTWIVDTMPGKVKSGFDTVKGIVKDIIQDFKDTFKAIEQAFTGLITFITGVFSGSWKKAWTDLKDIAIGIFTGVIDGVKGVLNSIGDGIGSAWNGVKNWATGGSSAPHNATGTNYWRGGLTHINERNRGELINLPSGTQIVPHEVSMRAASQPRSVVVNFTVQGNMISNNEFIDDCGKKITDRLKLALANV